MARVLKKKTAYQRYIEERYGPDAKSHTDTQNFSTSFARGLSTGYGAIGSDSASAARSGYNTPSSAQSGPGAGLSFPGVSAQNEAVLGATGGSAAHEAMFQAISEAEGTTKYGYNTVYGGGNGIAGRPLTGMTLSEVMDHQSNMIRNTNHSPLGRFQITRDTVQEHAKRLGLNPNTTKFDQTTQNRLALSIADTQGLKPTVWAGFKNNPGAFARAKQAYSTIQQSTPAQASYAMTGPGTGRGAGITYNIKDRTSSQGLTSGLMGALESAQQAARAAGLDHIEVRAGKGQGHLSHQQGTEADIVGYNADGSQWSKAQRVAVAQGAAGAGANRFGFYSGPTLHVGMGAKGLPSNVVWNDKLRGVPGVNTFAPEERDFVGALRTGKLKNLSPASSYTSTQANLSPAQQAAAAQASGGKLTYDPKVAATQKDLNSRGAKLTVDGIRGPLTRQAEQDYYGSPTSVRTPSFTNTPAQQAQSPTYTSGRQDAGTATKKPGAPPQRSSGIYSPAYTGSPYTNSTGGAAYTSGRGDEGRGVSARVPYTPRQVQTTAVDASGYPPIDPQQMGGGFVRPNVGPAIRTPIPQAAPMQWSSLQQPYASSTGGANAIVARTPQARPPQPGDTPTPYLNQPYTAPSWGAPATVVPISQPVLAGPVQEAVPTLFERLKDLIDIDPSQAKQALTSLGGFLGNVLGGNRDGGGSRSGNSGNGGNYSGGGGNYSGGNYGGQGGSNINQGIGGAYRNR